MSQPNIYIVKPEQVGGMDVMQFLRTAIAREFQGRHHEIVTEQTLEKPTPYSKTPRRLVGFAVECDGQSHTIYFDTTEVSIANTINWTGR